MPKVSVECLQYLSTGIENFRSTRFLATFTIEMIGNKADPVLKWVHLSKKQSTAFNLKWYREEVLLIIWLKTVFENLNLVESYDKTNLNVFVLSVRDKYRWGLTSLGQYSSSYWLSHTYFILKLRNRTFNNKQIWHCIFQYLKII